MYYIQDFKLINYKTYNFFNRYYFFKKSAAEFDENNLHNYYNKINNISDYNITEFPIVILNFNIYMINILSPKELLNKSIINILLCVGENRKVKGDINTAYYKLINNKNISNIAWWDIENNVFFAYNKNILEDIKNTIINNKEKYN